MKKTTKGDFEIFRKSFMFWSDKLGVKGYKIWFRTEDLESNFAECRTNETGKNAVIVMTSELADRDYEKFNPADSGKHEAIELLFSAYDGTAKYRYATPEQLNEERHRIIRTLEKFL